MCTYWFDGDRLYINNMFNNVFKYTEQKKQTVAYILPKI